MSNSQFAELLQRARREAHAGRPAAASTPAMTDFFDNCTACNDSHRMGHGMLYIPDFLHADAAVRFAEHIEANSGLWGGWARLHSRSLLNLGGVPHPSGTIAEYLPPTLQTLCERVRDCGALPLAADQCLLNRWTTRAAAAYSCQCSYNDRYSSGCGIRAHADGPLFKPHVAILSLGRPACIRFYRMRRDDEHDGARGEDEADVSVVLQPGSLFCFSGEYYTHYKHSIPDREVDVVPPTCLNAEAAGVRIADALGCSGCRYSVTLRAVSHVAVDAEQAELPMHLEERHRRRVWWLSSVNEKDGSS